MLKVYQMFCAIRYQLFNLNNVKNTHGGTSRNVKLEECKAAGLHYSWKYIIRRNVNSDLSIVTIFWSLVESIGVIKKMKEILLTEKEMVFLVLLYFHALLNVIILHGCFSRFLNCSISIKYRDASLKIDRNWLSYSQ